MLNHLGLFIDYSMIILFVALLGIVGLSLWFKKRKQKVLKIQSDKPKVDSNIEWTSFEFVQHLIHKQTLALQGAYKDKYTYVCTVLANISMYTGEASRPT